MPWRLDTGHLVDVTDANFLRAGTHVVEWLPVLRLQACLVLAELKTCVPTRLVRESDQIGIGRTNPADLHLSVVLHSRQFCTNFYTKGRKPQGLLNAIGRRPTAPPQGRQASYNADVVKGSGAVFGASTDKRSKSEITYAPSSNRVEATSRLNNTAMAVVSDP